MPNYRLARFRSGSVEKFRIWIRLNDADSSDPQHYLEGSAIIDVELNLISFVYIRNKQAGGEKLIFPRTGLLKRSPSNNGENKNNNNNDNTNITIRTRGSNFNIFFIEMLSTKYNCFS